MRDAFYEESAISKNSASETKKYTVFRIVSYVFFALTGISLLLFFYLLPMILAETSGAGRTFSIIQWVLPAVTFLASAIVFMRMKFRYNLSFDYTFVEDELRISKVFNGKKRKYLFKMKSDTVLKIGLCERESFERTLAGHPNKPIYLTPNRYEEPAEGKMFVYVVHSDPACKNIYILECREMLLEHLVQAVGRNKLELQ